MDSIQSKGGFARAEKLSKAERSRIAIGAARARWSAADGLPVATHTGKVKIGAAEIPCAVLDNGLRVLTEHGITTAMGSRSGGSKRLKRVSAQAGDPVPIFIAPQNVRQFISEELENGLLKPISYRSGRQTLVGYDARVLRAICEVWLDARRAGALQGQQQERAYRAELLIRGLADVAIVALVDEATGYQEERDKDELQQILAAYISPSLLPWAEKFPKDFFREMFRVFGWPWPVGRAGAYPGPVGPRYAGKLVKQIIYNNLPPGVLDELEKRNPHDAKWQRRNRMGQLLSEEIGHPHVEKLVAVITTLFEISDSKAEFWRHYKRKFDKGPEQLELELLS
jgi:P63C domain